MADFIAPIDIDSDEANAADSERLAAWVPGSGTPYPVTPPIPDYDRRRYFGGMTRPSKFLVERVDRYFQNFRIIDADGKPQIQDSTGVVHDAPDGVTTVSQVVERSAGTGVKVVSSGWREWLIFVDRDRVVKLKIPTLGWDTTRQLEPFVARFGWKWDNFPDMVGKLFPGTMEAPYADVGEPLVIPSATPAGSRSHWWHKA